MKNAWDKFEKPITILAPMADVTDFAFRELINKIARPDIFFTEFVSTDGLNSIAKNKIDHRLKFSPGQKPIIAQIWGTEPSLFFETAKILQKLNFDGIDINTGCPDKAVQKKGAGAKLINNYDLTSELIKALKAGAPNLAISVKTRLSKTEKLTKEWFEFLLSQDLSALSIHGRKAKDLSKGNANWDMIGKAVEIKKSIKSNTLVIGNGDIESYKEILEMHQKYGVDGVMVGRGIFKNPWLFEKSVGTKKRSQKEYFDLMVKHINLFRETWGEQKNFHILKKFFKVYVKDYPGANEDRQKLMECKTYDEVLKVIKEIY